MYFLPLGAVLPFENGTASPIFHVLVWEESKWASSSVDAKLCSLDLLAYHQWRHVLERLWFSLVGAVTFYACTVTSMKTTVCVLVINCTLSTSYLKQCYLNLGSTGTLINLSEIQLSARGHIFCLFPPLLLYAAFLVCLHIFVFALWFRENTYRTRFSNRRGHAEIWNKLFRNKPPKGFSVLQQGYGQ